MPPIYIHLIIGIVLAEIILRKIENDPETFAERRKEKRWWFLLAGGLGGLSPDLDIVPALITGQPIFAYHFIYTHTLIAMGILFALVLITRFNPYMLTYFIAYGVHLLTDLIYIISIVILRREGVSLLQTFMRI
jgi:membrane-bound metal-dependent hydrolase YbcI (DUF457 family)